MVPLNIKADMTSIGLKLRPTDDLRLASARGAAESTKKWLPGREGKGKNEPLSKFAISQPIKSGKKFFLDFGS